MASTPRGPFATGPIAPPIAAAEVPAQPPARDPRYDNQPPLGERIMQEFEEDLVREGLLERTKELEEAAGRAPPCDSSAAVGKLGDFCKQVAALEKAVEAVREKHNRPLIEARTQLKGRTDGLLALLQTARETQRRHMDDFMRKEQARVDAERRAAEEQRRRLQEEEDRRASLPEYAVKVEAPKIDAPVARGDLGARVGTRTVWKFEIEKPIAELPKHILEHAKVREAIEGVIGQMVRNGTRDIEGVRIYPTTAAAVR
jgi:hypothetical protein